MSVNFFESTCREASKTESEFGICDDQNQTKAYTLTTNKNKWIATVKNDNNKSVSFTAIDNCILVYKEGTKDKESTCDGMLNFTDSLYLVELKDKGHSGWKAEAVSQLENTIRLINEHHNLDTVKYKKAYACNKKFPVFRVIDAAERKAFFHRTKGYRLDIQAEIVI